MWVNSPPRVRIPLPPANVLALTPAVSPSALPSPLKGEQCVAYLKSNGNALTGALRDLGPPVIPRRIVRAENGASRRRLCRPRHRRG